MYFDAPAPGTYSVSIHVYNPQGAAPQQPFRLRIKDGDKVDVRTGTVVHGQGNWTTQFTLGGN
jgi:CO/xanthine dehydrogenase Mo-binding subunit